MRAWWVAALAAAVVGMSTGAPLAAQSPRADSGRATGRARKPDVTINAGTGMSKASVAAPNGALNTNHGSSRTVYASGKRQWGPLLTYQQEALGHAQALTAHKSPGRNELEVEALGRALAGEEHELDALGRTATGADRDRVTQVRAHEREARAHYDELVKAMSNPSAVAQHAAAVHQHLAVVEDILTPIRRAFGGQPRDTGSNVIRRAIP